jgi:hypothetical protein
MNRTKKNWVALGLVLLTLRMFAQQYDGYTLYAVQNQTAAYLIDTNGTNYHTWTFASTAKTGYSSYLLPGGTILRSVAKTGNSFSGGPICGQIQKVDYNGNVTWDYVYSTTNYCTHHDICPMPNGNVLLIAYERKTAAEVTAAGCSTFSSEMWPDKIVEVQQTGATTGTVVWEWHAWDHLVQNTNANAANYQTSIVNHPELLNINQNAQKDWMHMNGVDYNPVLDQIVFSCHNLNEVFVIDHSTTTAEAASHSGGNSGKGGDILYRWGKPTNYGATGTAIINVCHDAHWIKEGMPHENHLSYYNNNGISTSASCGDIFLPPYNGYNYSINLGSAFLPSTYVKRQASGGSNSNMGNIQELPNGNIQINMGISGIIKEFSPAGTLLWSKTLSGANAKAFRYSSCYINNAAPATPSVSSDGTTLTATSATSYQWYYNGYQIAGATSQTYTPTASGNYKVRITDSNGCVYMYSDDFDFSIATNASIGKTINEKDFTIYPNPTEGFVNINAKLNDNYTVAVFDMMGRTVCSGRNNKQVDLSQLQTGVYKLVITLDGGSSLNKSIVLTK